MAFISPSHAAAAASYRVFCRTTNKGVRDFCHINARIVVPGRSHGATTKPDDAVTYGNVAGIWAA
jgi:hypothetical protein